MPRRTKADPAPTRAELVAQHVRSLQRGKLSYKKADAAMDLLEKEMQPGEVVQVASGKKFRFVDKFADRNKLNVGLNARRYEFEEVTLP